MIRAIIRIGKSVILFSIPLGLLIGLIVGELWVLKWLYGFLGGTSGNSDRDSMTVGVVVMIAGIAMVIGSIAAFAGLIGDKGCEAYQELIVQTLKGNQPTNKNWWKV